MLSPYQDSFIDINGELLVDVLITSKGSKLSQRVVFTEEEFMELMELFEDMFPPKEEGQRVTFDVDADYDYKIEEIQNVKSKEN